MPEQREFFNARAAGWDAQRATDTVKLAALVARLGLQSGDKVLDVGCGTGVITGLLAAAVGTSGQVLAVDVAEAMLAIAGEKWGHLPQVRLVAADVCLLPPEPRQAVVCLNVYPHFADKAAFIARMREWLLPGGTLTIMHDLSRREVNAIHQTAAVVAEDRLAPAPAVIELLTAAGYQVLDWEDSEVCYFIRATT